MSFQVAFQAESEAEFSEAIAWYDSQTDGVGQKFSREVHATLSKAAKDHERFPFAGPTTQKIKMLDWPYSIYFTLLDNSPVMIVVSVFHGARNPVELRRRLK
jgi:plasmid stabilization system protein ParE